MPVLRILDLIPESIVLWVLSVFRLRQVGKSGCSLKEEALEMTWEGFVPNVSCSALLETLGYLQGSFPSLK